MQKKKKRKQSGLWSWCNVSGSQKEKLKTLITDVQHQLVLSCNVTIKSLLIICCHVLKSCTVWKLYYGGITFIN